MVGRTGRRLQDRDDAVLVAPIDDVRRLDDVRRRHRARARRHAAKFVQLHVNAHMVADFWANGATAGPSMAAGTPAMSPITVLVRRSRRRRAQLAVVVGRGEQAGAVLRESHGERSSK